MYKEDFALNNLQWHINHCRLFNAFYTNILSAYDLVWFGLVL